VSIQVIDEVGMMMTVMMIMMMMMSPVHEHRQIFWLLQKLPILLFVLDNNNVVCEIYNLFVVNVFNYLQQGLYVN